MTPEALAIARAHASRDRDTLARLRVSGEVKRDPSVGSEVLGADAFQRDVEARVRQHRSGARPGVNLALRPKKKRR